LTNKFGGFRVIHANKNIFRLSTEKLCLISAASLLSFSAEAAVVSFSSFQHVGSDSIDYVVTIEDDAEDGVTAGNFRISYEVADASPSTVGKLTGFFLDFGEPTDPPVTFSVADLGLSNEVADGVSCGQAVNADSVNAGGGCNTQLQLGAGAGDYQGHEFDIAVAWKNNDVSSFGVSSFEISNLGYTISDISAVALRGQATSGPGGSAKDFAVTSTTVVPIPAAALLFSTALAGLFGVRRKSSSALVS